jgi:hypothetical protein
MHVVGRAMRHMVAAAPMQQAAELAALECEGRTVEIAQAADSLAGSSSRLSTKGRSNPALWARMASADTSIAYASPPEKHFPAKSASVMPACLVISGGIDTLGCSSQ